MSDPTNEIFRLSDGDIRMWIVEESTLHLKCVTPEGDPVELNVEEVKELCELLTRLAPRIE